MDLYCLTGDPRLAIKRDVHCRVWHGPSEERERSQGLLMHSRTLISDRETITIHSNMKVSHCLRQNVLA